MVMYNNIGKMKQHKLPCGQSLFFSNFIIESATVYYWLVAMQMRTQT